jgi:outer membrane protein assembly factor BamB
MNAGVSNEPSGRKPLRLWPGVAVAALQWLVFLVAPLVEPRAAPIGILGGVLGGLIILVWWLCFSRARWLDRLAALALMVVAPILARRLADPSIVGGMMGMMLFIYAIPPLSLALVVWATASRRLADTPRRVSLVFAMLLGCVPLVLVRSGGITGAGAAQFAWRWSSTPEQRLLARPSKPPEGASTNLVDVREPEWPGFRGPRRDGVLDGVRVNPNWSAAPPVLLWDRPVGPGWSSFAVQGGVFFTQEQRGESELVACYNVASGAPVWTHAEAVRFWESNAGAGPRATPTLHRGRVYAFGATGVLTALDARDGTRIWSRNAAADMGRKVPEWGFAGSPLVVNDLVVVAAAGRLAAYDLASGKPRWTGPAGGWGYSSPHLAKLDGVEQILLLNGAGAISLAPADGKVLWEHAWRGDGIVQPGLPAEADVLIGSGSGFGAGAKTGTRRLAIKHAGDAWTVEERWTSTGLKPYYNDYVLHKGHAFGFDGGLLACIDLNDGKRKWKGGRYGYGQMILLRDQDLLLVLSETGDLALVKAASDDFQELARAHGITGKTWNHPVLARDVLLVRNDQQMGAFRLALNEPSRSGVK